MIIPVSTAKQRLHLSGLRVDGDELQWPSFCQAVLHHLAFAWIRVTARRRRWSRWPAFLNGCGILVIDNSCEQRFIRVNCRDGGAGRQFRNLARGLGIYVVA